MANTITRSTGETYTEKVLSQICDKVFLKLWTYPNPYKKIADELCDILIVFEENIFIFSVKDISFSKSASTEVAWKRWKRKAIDESIDQIKRAENWILNYPDKVFLDAKCEKKIPINIDVDNCKIHRFVIAHGAEQACREHSDENIAGSLAIAYSDKNGIKTSIFPFMVNLPRDKIYHVFDSANIDIIFSELDTIRDLLSYLEAKESAVKKHDSIWYCGEEDLLAHYFYNFNSKNKCHYIGDQNKSINGIVVSQGMWSEFFSSQTYLRKKEANEISYFWDELLQKTFRHAFDGTLLGDGDIFNDQSALCEMAKEPRFIRRALAEGMTNSIKHMPKESNKALAAYGSFYDDKMYVFLQFKPFPGWNYETKYRPFRQEMLKIACGVLKTKAPNVKQIIGIAIDPPKYNKIISEDFILFDCENCTKEDEDYYIETNKELKFFDTYAQVAAKHRVHEFPPSETAYIKKKTKTGRNEQCPCGSGRKYKRCCL